MVPGPRRPEGRHSRQIPLTGPLSQPPGTAPAVPGGDPAHDERDPAGSLFSIFFSFPVSLSAAVGFPSFHPQEGTAKPLIPLPLLPLARSSRRQAFPSPREERVPPDRLITFTDDLNPRALLSPLRRMAFHGRFPHPGYPRRCRAEDHAAVQAALRQAGAEVPADRPPAELSGGGKRSVWRWRRRSGMKRPFQPLRRFPPGGF